MTQPPGSGRGALFEKSQSDLQVAAFDPLFFMHHANLDRLVAMYQRRNPDSWIEPTHERHVKNYMVGLKGHMSNSSTPLWPFR